MLSCLALLMLGQGAAKAPAVVEPPKGPQLMSALPAGMNEAFLTTSLSVQQQLQNGKFAAAATAAKLLPKAEVRIEWDDSKVPANRKQELIVARDKALKTWQRAVPSFKWTIAKPGDMKFTFVPTLPPNHDTPMPAGAVQFFSEDPKDARLEVVIALKRGNPPMVSESVDVHNEVAFGLVSYYGVERNLGFGHFSTRAEVAGSMYSLLGRGEIMIARAAMDMSTKLRKAIAAKTAVIAAKPQIRIDPKAIEGGNALQGDIVPYTIQITNIGNAPLNISIAPDCGCVITNQPGTVAPSGSALLQVQVDTTDFVGELAKKLVIYSNDPEQPTTPVHIRLNAKPRFRFIEPNGNVALLGSNGGMFTLYFIPQEGSGLEPVQASVDGVPGTDITVTEWSGDLADPEMNEPEKPRKGFKIVLDYQAGLPRGRSFTTLVLQTNAKEVFGKEVGAKFETINRTVQVQNGIIANPESMNVGEISRMPQRFSFFITKPHAGFKITKLESGNPHLTLTAVATREDWEYRVVAQFDGKADFGILETKLTVHTSDKRDPVIVVPFRAVVR